MSSRRAQPAEQSGIIRGAKPVLLSVAAGLIVCIVILLLMSLVLSTRNIPQSLVGPMATFAVVAGAFVAGFCCAKKMRQSGLVYGLVCGGIMALLVLLAGIPLPGNTVGLAALLKVGLMLLAAMLGGVLGVNTRQRRRV